MSLSSGLTNDGHCPPDLSSPREPKRRRLNDDTPRHECSSKFSLDLQSSLLDPEEAGQARARWAKNAQTLGVLQNHDGYGIPGNESSPALQCSAAGDRDVANDATCAVRLGDDTGEPELKEEVCFGMVSHPYQRFTILHSPINNQITNIRHTLIIHSDSTLAQNWVSLDWTDSEVLLDPATGRQAASLQAREFKILQQMVVKGDLKLQLSLVRALQAEHCKYEAAREPHRKYTAQTSVQLFVVLYGSPQKYDDVGDFLQDCGIYLQDPIYCDRNVRYLNPHRLADPIGDNTMTFDIKREELPAEIEELTPPVDLYAQLDSDDFVSEAEQPADIFTPLHR